MDARILRAVTLTVLLPLALSLFPARAEGANYRTQNFLVTAPTAAFAKHVGDEAERFRKELSLDWLGYELPAWGQPCPISVKVGPTLGAGGVTTFSFDKGQVHGWQMAIEGPPDRVVDAVLPHEVTHTIFASHFRRPLPRWADEGACTTVEHESERTKQEQNLVQYLHTDRGIPFSRMFAMKEYPRDILPLYSQGYSLARYLILQGGRRKFIAYLGEGMETENWIGVTKQHYGFEDLRQLQDTWLEWVRQGSPLPKEDGTVLAAAAVEAAPTARPEARPEARIDPQVRPASAVAAAAGNGRRSNNTQPAPYSRGPILRAQNPEPTPEETERLVAVEWPGKTATRGPEPERRAEGYQPEEGGAPLAAAPRAGALAGTAPRNPPGVRPGPAGASVEDEVDSTGWRPSGPARTTAVAAAPRNAAPRDAAALASAEPPHEEVEVLLEWSRPVTAARAPTSDFSAPSSLRDDVSPGSTAPARPASASVAIPKWPNRPTVVDAPAGNSFRR